MTWLSRPLVGRIMWMALSAVCAAVLSLAAAFLYLDPQIPDAASYRQVRLETPLRIYTADRELIAEYGQRRLIPVTLDQVPQDFVRAVLDTEDKRFYEHNGVDFVALSKATADLIMNMGEITRGGSTITMQLPRNLGTFSLDQVFIRKFKEILLALKIEQELSKDEILELYINAVPFGKRAYGAQAAAFTYYGKPLDELSLAQLAMLAGIPQAPTAGNPVNDPSHALARRNVVLARMRGEGSITAQQFEAAVSAPLTARLHGRELDVAAPFPADWVRRQLLERIPDLYSGGYEVITTLDADLQRAANRSVRDGLLNYDRRHGYRGAEARVTAGDRDAYLAALSKRRAIADLLPAVVIEAGEQEATALLRNGREVRLALEDMTWARPYLSVNSRGPAPQRASDVLSAGDVIRVRQQFVPQAEDADAGTRWVLAQIPEIQGALVSLEPRTGAVQALVGGFDFSLSQYNHALQAARQPGSGFKPFVYAAALANGVTPASVFMDAPLVFADRNLESEYRPDNDSNRYNGPTRLREALYRSINLVTMRVLLEVGADRVVDYVERFGFETRTFPRNTQLAVGGGTMAVTPLEMAAAYATFANGGYRIEPHLVKRVLDIEGNTVLEPRHPEVCQACESGPQPVRLPPLPELEAAGALATAEQPGPEIVPAERVLDERVAYLMHSMLQDVIQRGTGRRARRLERSDLGGKTGTTNEAADTWFNGYNPDIATTVWVGFPDHQPLGSREYGSSTPLPIWMDYMKVALEGRPEKSPAQPSGVVSMKIDPDTGEVAGPGDSDAIYEYFLAEHAPQAAREGRDSEDEDVKPVEIF